MELNTPALSSQSDSANTTQTSDGQSAEDQSPKQPERPVEFYQITERGPDLGCTTDFLLFRRLMRKRPA